MHPAGRQRVGADRISANRRVVRWLLPIVAIAIPLLASAPANATMPGARGTLTWGSGFGVFGGDPTDSSDSQHSLTDRSTFIGAHAGQPSWSPDGTQLAYSAPASQGGPYAIWVVNADGTGAHTVSSPTSSDNDSYPTWAPEGQRIAYQRAHYPCADENCTLVRQLRVKNVQTGDDLLGQTLPGFGGYSFEWSPDGSQLAYEARGDNNTFELYVVSDLNTAPVKIATSGPHSQLVEPTSDRLSWSPDSTQLAWAPFGEKTIHFYDATSHEETGTLTPSAPGASIGNIAYTNDGARMVALVCPESDPALGACSNWMIRLDNPTLDFDQREPDEKQMAGPGPGGPQSGFDFQPQRQPIIFIHGFAGSRIACGSDELWPPTIGSVGSDLLDMQLADDGSSPASGTCGAEPSGILDSAYGSDVYQSTLDFLDQLTTDTHVPHYTFVWDWRKDPRQQLLALNTMVNDALNAPEQKAEGVKKVVLMGHSMGGLVMRAYLNDPSLAQKVSRAVTIGTPYWGAPKAIFPLAAGIESPGFSALNAIMALSKTEFQQFARNLMGAYFLYPSANYGPWLTVDGRSPSPLDQAGLLNYVDSLHGNSGLLSSALSAHANTLDGFKENGVEFRAFVGTGLNTIGAVRLSSGADGLAADANVTWTNGDGTVPVKSAVQGPAGTSDPLGDDIPISYVCGVGHVALPGSPLVDVPLHDFLAYGTPPKKSQHICPAGGDELYFALTGTDGTGTNAATKPDVATSTGTTDLRTALSDAEAAGQLQFLDLPDVPIAEIDDGSPVNLTADVQGLRFAFTPISGETRGTTVYYGPITGQLTLSTDADGNASVLQDGSPVSPRTTWETGDPVVSDASGSSGSGGGSSGGGDTIGGSSAAGGASSPAPTGRRAAALKKCKRKHGVVRKRCIRRARKLAL
jgi:pimeloyl-ACP methyl ester carboxylesterase